jgi:2-dehydro-3-deoxyphosphooctonate aldolase (KDO 8-P synthase)
VKPVKIADVQIGPGKDLVLIAGPCVIESRDHTLALCEAIKAVAGELGLPFIFKASFDKANRSSINSFRGPGLEKGLAILSEVRSAMGVPVTSDVHLPDQADAAGEVLDVIQIPAFLCRQTDLLLAAAETGRPVNVKKGQFMSPDDMRLAVEKIHESGNDQVLLTERGTFFGYGRLVNDLTSIPRMAEYAPVVFDATHSCQLPGAGGTQTGGRREFAPTLAKAAIAAGVHALFLEVHDQPAKAKSDSTTVWPLDQLRTLLQECKSLADARNPT